MRMIHDKDGTHMSYSHKIVYLLLSLAWSLLCHHKLKMFFWNLFIISRHSPKSYSLPFKIAFGTNMFSFLSNVLFESAAKLWWSSWTCCNSSTISVKGLRQSRNFNPPVEEKLQSSLHAVLKSCEHASERFCFFSGGSSDIFTPFSYKGAMFWNKKVFMVHESWTQNEIQEIAPSLAFVSSRLFLRPRQHRQPYPYHSCLRRVHILREHIPIVCYRLGQPTYLLIDPVPRYQHQQLGFHYLKWTSYNTIK